MIAIRVIHVIQEEIIKIMFRKSILLILLSICSFFAQAQDKQLLEGAVSYINSENVYIKFPNTNSLKISDTLEVFSNGSWSKSLVINALSSTSCVAKNIGQNAISINSKVRFSSKINQPNIPQNTGLKKDTVKTILTTIDKPSTDTVKRKESFDGRIYVSSYGNLDGGENAYNQFRTSLSFNINNINDGALSFESYLNYRPRWGSGSSNNYTFADDFKVYSLALLYDINPKTNIVLGRRINNRIANIGAVDGLQIERKHKHFIFGGFGGFSPDFNDYSFNSSLLQYGAFVAHEIDNTNGQIQSSVAIAEQRNAGNVDRRFLYFQHSNTMLKNLSLFYSLELDVFQNVNNTITNNINLTSTYLSLRYRPFRQFSISASYDNRRNVIYYETYRTFIDQLINQETRQGLRLQTNINVTKFMSFNVSSFYRYQESRPLPTKNYVINFNIAQILGNGSYLNINYNTMDTYYFNGDISGASLSQNFFNGYLSTELNYRKVKYSFFNENQPSLQQDIIGASLNYYGKKRTSIMLSYEGTFEPERKYNRYFVTISQRFKSKK